MMIPWRYRSTDLRPGFRLHTPRDTDVNILSVARRFHWKEALPFANQLRWHGIAKIVTSYRNVFRFTYDDCVTNAKSILTKSFLLKALI